MRILITGGAGFIGSHIVDRCVAKGYDAIVLDDLSNSTISNLRQHLEEGSIEFLKGDIRDLRVVKRLMHNVDAVFHEAAQVSVPSSIKDPEHTHQINVGGTLNLLIAASDERVERFIYASSSSVYGDPANLPVKENSPITPLSPYAASKAAGEAYCTSFHLIRNLPTVCLRYFNVFGPRQRLDGYAGVIPAFIRNMLSGKPVIIFGDGTQTRDFVHVGDVVEANMLALNTDTALGCTFNIGSGKAISITELADVLGKVSDVEHVPRVHAAPRKGDIRHSVADIEKAKRTLGYRPKTALRSGLETLFKSYERQFMNEKS